MRAQIPRFPHVPDTIKSRGQGRTLRSERRSPDALGLEEGVSRSPIVQMYYCDREPPPFHVRDSGQNALIAIETLALLRGRLSPRALGLVTEWAAIHRAELMEDWILARAEGQIKPIAPLE